MKILLIEDDETKGISIKECINAIDRTSEIQWKRSWQSGLTEILDNMVYDYIFLDMSMPRYDASIGDVNEEFEPFAGKELLEELERKNIIVPVSIITSFDVFGKDENYIDAKTLNQVLAKEFKDLYLGMISYSYSNTDWKKEIAEVLKNRGE